MNGFKTRPRAAIKPTKRRADPDAAFIVFEHDGNSGSAACRMKLSKVLDVSLVIAFVNMETVANPNTTVQRRSQPHQLRVQLTQDVEHAVAINTHLTGLGIPKPAMGIGGQPAGIN